MRVFLLEIRTMAEENKDLNKNQSVADSDLNKDQSVAGQDLNALGQGGQAKTLADGEDKDKKTVKYSEFEKTNEAKKAAEEQVQTLQGQMRLMVANQQPVQPQPPQQPKTTLEQAMIDCGVTADEMYGETTIRVLNRKSELDALQNQHTSAALANQQFESSHPDYGNVVGVRNPLTGAIQPTAEILKILTEKPHLAATAYASSKGAYEIVMQERELEKLRQENTVNQEHLEQRGLEDKLKPTSGAAAGGAMNTASGKVTVEQQQEMEERVASGEFNKGV
jgi:hypothetical protein